MTAYAQPTGSITNALDRLRNHIAQVPERVNALSDADMTQRVPGKWSRKEILGHLIDSALNNLKRFTDAPLADRPYLLQGYQQDDLVEVNRYQQLPLAHLLTLWSSLNVQIVYVTEALPVDSLSKQIRFSQSDVPDRTLGWLIEDYVAHLEHHLKTLL
ncbi:DinB family protein [Spirosoma arcticum]